MIIEDNSYITDSVSAVLQQSTVGSYSIKSIKSNRVYNYNIIIQ